MPDEVLDRLRAWLRALAPLSVPNDYAVEIPEGGWLRVLKPASRVARRDSKGLLTDIEIIRPLLMSVIDDQPATLHYQYRPANAPSGLIVARFAPETAIERVGDDWAETLWNPSSDDYKDEDDAIGFRCYGCGRILIVGDTPVVNAPPLRFSEGHG